MDWPPFIEGFMPLQLLAELGGFLLLLSGISYLLEKQFGVKVNKFFQATGLFVFTFLYLKFRVYPPLPASILTIYLVGTFIAIMLWVSATEAYWEEFQRPILMVLDAKTGTARYVQAVSAILFPLIAWIVVFDALLFKVEDPVELRTVQPAPPRLFTVHGQQIDISAASNPHRVNPKGQYDFSYTRKLTVELAPGRLMKPQANPWNPRGDPFLTAVLEGGKIYFQECVFCHGANLNGRGIVASSMNPFPVNFTDPGTIAQLQESYVFWRTATGGLGLPREGFPWASTMPRMEEHLSTDDIWKVVIFEYWHTGWVPRTWD